MSDHRISDTEANSLQRVYKPHGMPRRDPQTERTLARVLGKEVSDESSIKTVLPNDVSHQIGKVLEQNRELKAELPAISTRMDKLESMLGALLEKLGGATVAAQKEEPAQAETRRKRRGGDDSSTGVPTPEV